MAHIAPLQALLGCVIIPRKQEGIGPGGVLDKERKSEIIEDFKQHDSDTGSVQVQVAILTNRISELTVHLRQHKKDVHSRMGLLKLVGQRRSLLNYLSREDVGQYRTLISRLGLRR